MNLFSTVRLPFLAGACSLLLTACSFMPSAGPSATAVNDAGDQSKEESIMPGIQVVDVTDGVARQLQTKYELGDFARTLGTTLAPYQKLGAGDVIEVSIWEAPPAALFGVSNALSAGSATARVSVLPEQVIERDGNINVPFVGSVRAAGRSLGDIEKEITQRLQGKANQPQVMARLVRNSTAYVTIVGEVGNNTRMPLSPRGETLLDAIASAGGVRTPLNKTTISITRGDRVEKLALSTVINNPKQNVPLQAGDVITAVSQSSTFIALGATGRNQEVPFEAQGITLAQALGRVSGLDDNRANPQGVFIFRFEDPNALPAWPHVPVQLASNNKVPVVYRINMKDPATFFIAQGFIMQDQDVLYIANAPVAELQKFMNLLTSIAYPVLTGITAARTN